MRHPKLLQAIALLGSLSALACVTINVYFPEAAVKDLSEQIENAILKEAGASEESTPATSGEQEDTGEKKGTGEQKDTGETQNSALRHALEIGIGTALHWLPTTEVLAQGNVAAPEISNPAIRQIIKSRSTRISNITRHKASGVLGENNKALLEVRNLAALALRDRAAVQKLVREENADRQRMFKEIAAATGTNLSQLPQIQATYAATLRAKAKKGEWTQQSNGQWKQK
jgi:uncharacterized protein YdbL (DUF1318 family)